MPYITCLLYYGSKCDLIVVINPQALISDNMSHIPVVIGIKGEWLILYETSDCVKPLLLLLSLLYAE